MKFNWDLTHLYANDLKWQNDYEKLICNINKLKEMVTNCLEDKDKLAEFLKLFININILIEKTYCYAKRHVDIDSSLENYKNSMNDVLTLYGDFQNVSNIFENILMENSEIVLEYLNDEKLKKYNRYINLILRKGIHITKKDKNFNYSKEQQELKDKYRELINNEIKFQKVDIDGENIEINRNSFDKLIIDSSQKNRKKVFDAYNEAFVEIEDKIYAIYKSKLENDIRCAKMENYDSLLEKNYLNLNWTKK